MKNNAKNTKWQKTVDVIDYNVVLFEVNNHTLQTIQSKNEDNGTIQSSNMTDNQLQIGAYNRASYNNTNN